MNVFKCKMYVEMLEKKIKKKLYGIKNMIMKHYLMDHFKIVQNIHLEQTGARHETTCSKLRH